MTELCGFACSSPATHVVVSAADRSYYCDAHARVFERLPQYSVRRLPIAQIPENGDTQ